MNSMRKSRIESILIELFQPKQLVVEDESHMHSGHSPETHFKVLVVSEKFKTKSRIERQRLVNEALKEEFDIGLHALSLRCLTPEESLAHFQSPNCASKKT